MNKPTLTGFGGVGAVTGANFLLEIGDKRVLVDCGLLQGVPNADSLNAGEFDYDPSTIDYLFITHSHIDHIGKIPKLVKDGFRGVIHSTNETREIAKLMLADMAHIVDEHAREEGKIPLYGLDDVEKSFNLWHDLNYHEPKHFGEGDAGFTLELYNAGHILGSAMYKFTRGSGRSILFTGDTGNSPAPLEHDTEPVEGLDYLLIDSVYGDRNHETPEVRDEKFKAIIKEAAENNRTVVIPTFSLERAQVLLYQLRNLFDSGEVREIPVFLDSPLAIRVTNIYERAFGDVFDFPKLRETVMVRESKDIDSVHGAKIILAGSGMSTAGRVQAHEMRYLPDPKAIVLFVGYQAPNTLGRTIQSGEKHVYIKGERIPVRARIESIDGFSAHRDSDHLVEFVSHSKDTLRKVFVVMGEPKSEIYLAQRVHDELGVDAMVPKRGERIELDL
jgi:metallo-beta-lactamase family protein